MGSLYSDKNYQRSVEKAWEQFNSGIEIKETKLSQTILDSWGRSKQFEVSTELSQAPGFHFKNDAKTVLGSHSALRKAARPVIRDARNVLDDNQLFMILTSAEGTILEREGNSKTLCMADSQQLVVGSNWSEQQCGTNAVGTAISLQRPVQVVAREHYCDMTLVWGCAAVPIRDLRDGRILGVLDTTGPEHSFASMNLGWVNSMASCIGLRLNEERNRSKYQLLDHCVGQVNRWHKEHILIFDEEGFLVWENDGPVPSSLEMPLLLQSISVGERKEELAVEHNPVESPPAGIRTEWLEPIYIDDKIAGHLLILPSNERVSKPVTRNPDAGAIESLLKGGSESILHLRQLAERLSKVDVTFTITGETGTGKEVMAREVHALGRKEGEFVAVNCGAMQKDLLASELFGYSEGSFTGAKRGGMIGKFEAANNGTLLLDEFCDLPLDLQSYLLRVLEEREVVRVGESKPRPISARIIVATNKNLEEEVQAGRLREDLYYRINANVIELPPLRGRQSDILLLFNYFIKKISKENGGEPPALSEEFIKGLECHSWPGNIRELRNFAENCFLMNGGASLKAVHLPKRMLSSKPRNDAGGCTLKEQEKDIIVEALELFGGNVSKAARHLGIARSSIYKKIKKQSTNR